MRRSKSMHNTARKAWTEIKRRNDAAYDGVLGELTKWVPEPLRHEFHLVRGRLLDKHRDWKVRRWMAAMDDFHAQSAAATKTGKAYRGGFVSIPLEVTRDIEALRYIRDIESLGHRNGIEAYLGKGAAKVYRGTAISTHATKSGRLGGHTNTKDGSRSHRPSTKFLMEVGEDVAKRMRADKRYSIAEFKTEVRKLLEKAYNNACAGNRLGFDYPFKNKAGEVIRCRRQTLSDYFAKHKPADFVDD